MTERRDAIVRLLQTRDEHLPEPRHRTETTSGFVHGGLDEKGQHLRWLTCPDCLANEGLPRRFGCETCGGRGQVPDTGRDPYATNKVQPFGFDGSKHDAVHERDRQIEILRGQLRPARDVDELADANASPYGWERARKRWFRQFDFPALDAALELLRLADDGAYRALHAVWIYGWQLEPSTGPLQAACERGLAFLDERLPDPLRAPPPPAEPEDQVTGPLRPEAGARTKAMRDGAMRAAADAGASVGDLCARFGVSKSTVYAVVNRSGDAAA